MIYAVIILLTLFDILFSVIGLNMGAIVEANPVMRYLIDLSMPATAVMVAAIVAFAMLLFHKHAAKIKWLRYTLIFLLTIKIIVFGMHIGWVVRIVM